MTHINPLSEAIKLVGLRPLASRLGVSYQAIQKFEQTSVPAERVLAIAEATDWQVTPYQIRPDIYPHPLDGLPKEYLRSPKSTEAA
jgi:DNA-binding transcriptional regulator YdaS (Cro superfamily)